MSGFDISGKHIGDGAPCFVIAEVGLAHDGSLRIAHDFIDAIATTGADSVKFQCHLGDETDEWRLIPKWTSETRQEYWKRTGFSAIEWSGLEAHAKEKGLIFLCSPFSVEAVRLLDPLVPAWKVPSGMITNRDLINAIMFTGKLAILSTGMATDAEIDAVMLKMGGTEWAKLLRCTSLYPCPPKFLGLGNFWQDGLSDHSGTIYAGLAAVALGCDVLEVHVKLSEYDQGPDASSSLTIPKLKELVEGIRFIETAKANPVDKDEMAKELESMRRIFMRQPVASNLLSGYTPDSDDMKGMDTAP
jgi:N,N'-diacetyllegionaminate synthase